MPLGGHGDPGGTKLVAPTWCQRPIWPEVRFQHPGVDPAYQRRRFCSSVPASPPSCPPTQTLGSPDLCGRDNQGAGSEQRCVLGQQPASRAWAPCILLLPALPCSAASTVGPGPSAHHCSRSRRPLGTQRPADSVQPWCPCLAGDPAHPAAAWRRACSASPRGAPSPHGEGQLWALLGSLPALWAPCALSRATKDVSSPDLPRAQILVVPGPAFGSGRSAPMMGVWVSENYLVSLRHSAGKERVFRSSVWASGFLRFTPRSQVP